MSNIKKYLQAVDKHLNDVQPKTMDDLINEVGKVEGGKTYGHHFYIVRYMGALQGVRVAVTGRNKTHLLPAPDKVYSVLEGIEKFENAGWPVVNVDSTGKEISN